MFPSLRFMFAAVLSTLVILVIASSALVSVRRPDMPLVLHPVGSRPLTASWQTDDMQSFEARFGPQAMLINASVQLPPVERIPSRLDFVATANATVDTTKPLTPAQRPDAAIPDATAALAAAPISAPLPIEPPVATTPPVVGPREIALPPAVVAPVDLSAVDAPKIQTPVVVAAIEPAPVPAKDPQIASDAPAQASHRTAAILPAAPAAERPAFIDTSRTESIVKPAIKRRAQIKRPKKRIVRAPAPVAKPAAPTNPFAALFGSANTP